MTEWREVFERKICDITDKIYNRIIITIHISYL
jgi:hypothetical protein